MPLPGNLPVVSVWLLPSQNPFCASRYRSTRSLGPNPAPLTPATFPPAGPFPATTFHLRVSGAAVAGVPHRPVSSTGVIFRPTTSPFARLGLENVRESLPAAWLLTVQA